MSSIEQPYALGTLIDTGRNTNKTSPLKDCGKYLISRTSILSKSICGKIGFGPFPTLCQF